MTNTNQSLNEYIYEILKNKIMSLEIKPGTQLLETKLAKEYSVSRTPVREALNMLNMEELLTSLPKNGYVVQEISFKELLESFQIRIFLEKGAAELAVHRISEDDIQRLKELCVYENKEHIWNFNKEFHLIIARAANNSKLTKIIDRSLDEAKRALKLDPFMNLIQSQGKEEHDKIIEALQKEDGEKAAKAMEEHLMKTRERIYNQLINFNNLNIGGE